ncbi:hypothetical protein COLO4_34353 [Corchorus olitorius]|uniref:Uncharacterized protein n=1 Tax=Corchorus olitorius TaxID=93759 RepID=A0A1R3GLE3_9ROSI|nr:hypothetical protein COLO4_34353 [Corchorus olitorius]
MPTDLGRMHFELSCHFSDALPACLVLSSCSIALLVTFSLLEFATFNWSKHWNPM